MRLSKTQGTGISKTKHQITFCGESALEEVMEVWRDKIRYTCIPKLVNIVRIHENLSHFPSTEIQIRQLPVSRFSASELNLIDKTRTNGAVTGIASKNVLDKETPV
jgi:hypothetical protein